MTNDDDDDDVFMENFKKEDSNAYCADRLDTIGVWAYGNSDLH